jgi:hypothetical protein
MGICKLERVNKKLLIIPCSKVKKNLINASAIELYDGPFFRMIRKYNPNKFDILVLSAKYGIIEGKEKISYYDQKMTRKRADELSGEINLKLSHFLYDTDYDEVFINLGKIYFEALRPSMTLFDHKTIHSAKGGIGMRLHYLKNWICPGP